MALIPGSSPDIYVPPTYAPLAQELPVLRPPKDKDFNGADYADQTFRPAIRPPEQKADPLKVQRAQEARQHTESMKQAIQEYELLRQDIHEVLGRIYVNYVAANNLLAFPSPDLSLKDFREVNVPTLLPQTFIDAGWTSTAAAMADPSSSYKWPPLR